jgi:5'-methylthioadenosine phosphorylase
MQTHGPRFETAAEVRFLSTLGHVVGMTGAHEATHCQVMFVLCKMISCCCFIFLLQERGLKYACLCMVDNWANGLTTTPLTLEQFRALTHANEVCVYVCM